MKDGRRDGCERDAGMWERRRADVMAGEAGDSVVVLCWLECLLGVEEREGRGFILTAPYAEVAGCYSPWSIGLDGVWGGRIGWCSCHDRRCCDFYGAIAKISFEKEADNAFLVYLRKNTVSVIDGFRFDPFCSSWRCFSSSCLVRRHATKNFPPERLSSFYWGFD